MKSLLIFLSIVGIASADEDRTASFLEDYECGIMVTQNEDRELKHISAFSATRVVDNSVVTPVVSLESQAAFQVNAKKGGYLLFVFGITEANPEDDTKNITHSGFLSVLEEELPRDFMIGVLSANDVHLSYTAVCEKK